MQPVGDGTPTLDNFKDQDGGNGRDTTGSLGGDGIVPLACGRLDGRWPRATFQPGRPDCLLQQSLGPVADLEHPARRVRSPTADRRRPKRLRCGPSSQPERQEDPLQFHAGPGDRGLADGTDQPEAATHLRRRPGRMVTRRKADRLPPRPAACDSRPGNRGGEAHHIVRVAPLLRPSLEP